MWNVKKKLTLVIMGATGTRSESFRKYLSNILGKVKSRNYRKEPYWALRTYLRKF